MNRERYQELLEHLLDGALKDLGRLETDIQSFHQRTIEAFWRQPGQVR